MSGVERAVQCGGGQWVGELQQPDRDPACLTLPRPTRALVDHLARDPVSCVVSLPVVNQVEPIEIAERNPHAAGAAPPAVIPGSCPPVGIRTEVSPALGGQRHRPNQARSGRESAVP